MENVHTPNSIRTASGKYFDFVIMDPDTICIEDIAHALSAIPRYTGHTPFPYSVGQHCCMAAAYAPEHLKLEALLHDATEAYMMDIAKPLKVLLPDYKAIEKRLTDVIEAKFGLIHSGNPIIKEIDFKLLKDEWHTVMLLPVQSAWPRETVKELFLATYEKYKRL